MELEDDAPSFSNLLQEMAHPTKKRDPRTVRLAAVTSAMIEVIGGDDCSASKVYAKTVTALEGTLTSDAPVADSISTQRALLQLLGATIPHVSPPTIIVATLSMTSRVLRAIVASTQAIGDDAVMETKDELGGVSAVLRLTCRASSEVLKCLRTSTDEKSVKQFLLGTLVALLQDRRSSVRKAAQDGIIDAIVSQNVGGTCTTIIVKTISAHIHTELAKVAHEQSMDYFSNLLHFLPFVQQSILHLNFTKLSSDVMELLTALLQVQDMASTTDFVTSAKIREVTPKIETIISLLSIVSAMVEDDSTERKAFLDEFANRVLATLLQARPNLVFRSGAAEFEVLEQGRIQYGETALAACRRTLDSNIELACKLLPLVSQLVLILARPADETLDNATVAQTLLVELTQLFRTRLTGLLEAHPTSLEKCLTDMLRHMEQVLQPSFKSAWSVGLKSFSVFLQHVHSVIPIEPSIDHLICLRNEAAPGSPLQHLVEDSLSTLVQGLGIEKCWVMIRFQPDPAQDGISVDKAWILSILKTAATAACPVPPRLAFFQSNVITLARSCDKLAVIHKDQPHHRTRVIHIWSLFSCFCKSPSDIETALPALSTTLGRAMQDKRYPEFVAIICAGLVVLGREQSEKIGTEGISEGDRKALESTAVSILPILFKLVSDLKEHRGSKEHDMDIAEKHGTQDLASVDGQRIRSIVDAVAALAPLASKAFLHNLFQKLIRRLVEEVQSPSCDRTSVCALLSLSESMVISEVLETTSLALLYRSLKPLIRDDEFGASVQKRAYRVLAEICQRYHSFVADMERLKELCSLLTSTIMTSQVAARSMRLKCLSLIIDGLGDDQSEQLKEFSNILGEVLLCLKDSNAKSREAAYQVLLSLASRSNTSDFLQFVTAGLGAETPHMRSATLMALSRLVFTYAGKDIALQSQLPSLLGTVLVLINENSREVVKGVIGFVRICVTAIPRELLSPLLPQLVNNLLMFHKTKDRFRAKIKIIIKKLVKLYGYEALMPLVPATETRLLTHMRKVEERQKRKRLAEKDAKRTDAERFDEAFDSDEEDSDNGRTLVSGATEFSRLTGRKGDGKTVSGKSASSKASKLLKSSTTVGSKKSIGKRTVNVQLSNEMDGDVVDMLGSKLMKRVQFADEESTDDGASSDALEFNEDGKLVIRENEDEEMTAPKHDDSSTPGGRKKRRLNGDNSFQPGKSTKKAVKQGTLGASYRSKKAGGDVKKKGQKYEPYAFVPLDGRAYSKKNRNAAVTQMSTVVRGGGKRKRK